MTVSFITRLIFFVLYPIETLGHIFTIHDLICVLLLCCPQVLLLDERGLTPSSLTSPNRAGPRAIPCVVSGYPVMSHRGRNPVEFKRPGKQANRDDWNKLMMAAKMAPETQITDVLSFIGEWCGGAPSFSFQ